MYRSVVSVVGFVGVLALGGAGLTQCGPPASPTPLVVSPATAFAVLGASCGGISEQAFATGFDAASGYPVGDVFLKTTCSTGGRGSRPHTYSAWAATTWDFTGALVSYTKLGTTPTVDPTFSAVDAQGNQLYNQTNRAYIVLAAGFVPAPRVAGVAPSSGPQGSSVTITGTSFTGATAVRFGGLPAVGFTVNGDTTITAVAPAVVSGVAAVTVTGSGGTSAVDPADQFTFVPVPRVGAVSPGQGTADGGTAVTITGANFTGTTAVIFGGVPASFTVQSDTSITAIAPASSDSGLTVDVTVTSTNGTSATGPTDRFSYI